MLQSEVTPNSVTVCKEVGHEAGEALAPWERTDSVRGFGVGKTPVV